MKIKTTMLMMATALCTATSQATLLAYEGFDNGSTGNQTIQTALSGSGFTSMTNGNYRFVVTNGLSYTDGSANTLTSTGNSSGISPAVGGTQNLQLSFGAVSSGKLYVSFLTDIDSVITWGLAFGLQGSQVDGSISTSPNNTLEAGLRSTSNANAGWGLWNGNGLDERTTASTLGLSFLVMEVDIDNNAVTAWLNPTDLEDIANTSTVLADGGDTYTVGTVNSFLFSLGGDEAGRIDEIRIGTTIGDVSPIPEPATLGLVSLFGGTILFIRKRFMM